EMRDKRFQLVLALLSAWSLSSARADEPSSAVVAPIAMLRLVNGDELPGTPLDSDRPGLVPWQASAFTQPFQFESGVVAEIDFPATPIAAQDAGEFRF